MNTHKNTINGKLMNLMFGIVAVVMIGLASAQQAQAQLPPVPPVTLNYSFSVPVAKVVPNPCTNGFTLISGNAGFTIQTTQDSTSFKLKIDSTSSGKGEDALATGALILNGTQKAQYDYASTTFSEATFPTKPTTVLQTLTIGEYLVRSVDSGTNDSFIMRTVFEINYINGVPTLPILQSIDARCTSDN